MDRLELAHAEGVLSVPSDGPLLVIGAAPRPFLDAVEPERLTCEQGSRPIHDALADGWGGRGASVTLRANAPAAMVAIVLGRSRAANLGALARGLHLLPPGGLLALDGAKTDGIDSLARQLGGVLPLEGAFVKAHGRAVWLRRPDRLPAAVATWEAGAATRPNADGFLTAPGMFAAEAADPGSRRLAEAVAGGLRGRVADLGAGWGWLAYQALAGSPAIDALDLYEADAASLDAARANVNDPRAGFYWCDATALGASVPPYDAVVVNPPFHRGRAAEPELGAAFIAAAARILKPSGALWLVANRQLPYEATLEAGFGQITRLSEHGGYKVLRAARPRRAGAPRATLSRARG